MNASLPSMAKPMPSTGRRDKLVLTVRAALLKRLLEVTLRQPRTLPQSVEHGTQRVDNLNPC
jgi:hypothetical protein